MAKDFKTWEEAQKAWNKAIIKWQKAHPDKFWFDELCKAQTQTESDDDGGDRPPTPPKNP
jgi:hypothetical protein